MGKPGTSTVKLDSDDIIRIAIVGDVDEALVKQLIVDTKELIADVRARGKKVLVLSDQTHIGKIDHDARVFAQNYFKQSDYDRVAFFGASKKNALLMRYVIDTVGWAIHAKSFRTEARAVRWLKQANTPVHSTARRVLTAATLLLFLATAWYYLAAPYLLRLPANFSYEASVVSYDNFYNEQAASYQGATRSDTTFSYKASAAKGDELDIKNLFEVKTTAGEPIFAVERTYGINRRTGQHMSGHGDRDRTGYLFAPQNLHKQDFTYWHVNYDEPAHMQFRAEEDILGLKTYRYQATYTADQTKNLTHLREVGKTRGVNLDIDLQLWIEPTTGHLIKYEDHATAHYYSLATGQRINPWNRFTNRYSFDSIAAHVREARTAQQRKLLYQWAVPLVCIVMTLLLVLRGAVVIRRQKSMSGSTPAAGGRTRGTSRSIAVALIVCTPLLLLTAVAWQQSRSTSTERINLQFQSDANKLHETIANELNSYVKALQGARSLFAASENVSRDEWKAYIDGLRLPQNYPGMLGMGFIQHVPQAQLPPHTAQVRSQGFPSYAVNPVTTGDNAPVTYIEPFNERNQRAFGFNMLSEPTRRTALEQARDTGEPVLSSKVTLVQETSDDTQAGLLLFLPIYRNGASITTVEQRRAALTGYAYTPIRMTDFMSSTIGEQTRALNIALYDSNNPQGLTADNQLYSSGAQTNSSQSKFSRQDEITLGGNTLTTVYASLPTYNIGIESTLPLLVLVSGVVLSLLLTAFAFVLSSSRNRALRLAETMTTDLRSERNRAVTNQHKDDAILASIGDGVFVVDEAGKIILFNKAAESISGFDASEALGQPYQTVLAFYNSKTRESADDFIATALGGTKTEMAQHTVLLRKDETTVPVADSAAPVFDAKQQVIGAVVVFRDVSREQQLEHMKDEFVAIASHELRTPMTAIRGLSSMILKGDYGPVNKELADPMQDIRISTERLISLVNDLLNVSRIEAGRMRFTLAETSIRPIVQEMVNQLKPIAKEKHIALSSNVPAAKVQVDSEKCKQVLNNLLGNALKFTDKGAITVIAKLDKEQITLFVTDTGIGMPEAERGKLFGKFEQVSSQQQGRPAGTGLGLYISREMVRKMGGDLWLESSEPGKGSVFAFSLPLAGTKAAAAAQKAIDAEAQQHPDQK